MNCSPVIVNRLATITLIFGALALTSCQPELNNNNIAPPNVATTNTTNTNTNSAPAVTEKAAFNVPVTLPLLDAVLTDESFVSKIKTDLQLSDEELQKVRDAARNAVITLGQVTTSDDERSTRDSIAKARSTIRGVLGNQKADRLIAMVQQHWGGTDAGELPNSKPSAVPTDTRIVVNAPAYRMDVFANGELKASYKIGIGYPEFPLPVGLRKADTIIFNPTWTPPDEPWVKGKVAPGKKVAAGSKLNPLGPIKIPIGLPSLIHGGKPIDRLGTFASHGCVGLTDAQVQDFAMEIANLSEKPLTLDQIKDYAKEKTKTVDYDLAGPIPVELRYETIVVEDGKLKIYRDVYERGTNTEENLASVLGAFGVDLNSLPQVEREKILAGLDAMAVDAVGKPVEASATNSNSTNSNSNNSKKNTSEKVTRNIKGKKEMVFQITALTGKGYPAPMEKKTSSK